MKTKRLDDTKMIEKIDHARMRDIISAFPGHCQEAFVLGRNFSLPAKIDEVNNILFCGMGGSAIGGEIVSSYLREKARIAMGVNRDYSLPEFVDGNCLAIFISYSGNTEETLSAYHQARQKQAKIIVLTSGGQLADLAKKDGHPCLLIPAGFPPRCALPFLSFPILALFSRMGLIGAEDGNVEEVASLLEEMKKDLLGIEISGQKNPAKKLALRFADRFPVFYAACGNLSGVATRWRGQLAENSKALSSVHTFPEMNHNEIVGWMYPHALLKNFLAVILRDKEEHPQIQKRIEISKELLQKEDIGVEEVWSCGKSLLARIFSLIYIGDFVSFYLAILNGEDPTPVRRIDYLKKRLKES